MLSCVFACLEAQLDSVTVSLRHYLPPQHSHTHSLTHTLTHARTHTHTVFGLYLQRRGSCDHHRWIRRHWGILFLRGLLRAVFVFLRGLLRAVFVFLRDAFSIFEGCCYFPSGYFSVNSWVSKDTCCGNSLVHCQAAAALVMMFVHLNVYRHIHTYRRAHIHTHI